MTSAQRFRALLAIAAQLAIATTSSAQARQTLFGRVLGDSSRPIAGAVVSITMAPNRVLRQDTTRADGRWSVRFDSASGDYLVHIAALGHQAFRQRVTTMSSDTVVTVNAALSPNVQQLAAVTVKASRPKVARELDPFPLPDGISAEYITAGATGAVSPELQGDLAAIAAAIPGLALTAGGVSAFGLDALQNGATLNGMSFAGASLPRNAGTVTRFTTSTYDPSRGGFSGVETAVSLSPGNIYSRRRANVTIDAPPLQVTDRVSARLGQRVTGGLGSIGSSGSWVEDSWYYSASADVARRVSDAPSLLNADASLFPLAGVAADSVTQLLRTLSTLGIPATASGAGTQRIDDRAVFAVRIDHAPYKPQSFTPNDHTWAVIALGNVQRTDAQGFGLTQTPALGAQMQRASGVLQGIYSTFVRDYSLSETRTALSLNRTSGTPYLRLPSGNVLVSSSLPDGTAGNNALAFGGNAALQSGETQLGWETRSDYQWYAKFSHRMKLTAQTKVDHYHQDASGNTLGSFSFASLAELAANHPSSFTRTLAAPDRDGTSWTGFASLGDQWKVSPTLQVMYGARLEANHYLGVPAYNAALDNALGVRTDAAPSRIHLSPRMGFAWRYGGERAGYNGYSVSTVGTSVSAPRGLLRGGIGEFRSALPIQLLGAPGGFTGLANASRRIACVGQATPVPAWSAYATDSAVIPDACLGGGTSQFADVAPLVQVIDRAYDAPRSWRANLGLLTMVKQVGVSIDGNVALNLNQSSSVDANFSGVSQFALSDEGRPVFTSASSIDAASGLLSATSARRAPAFGRVSSLMSDLRSVSKQLMVNVAPQIISSYLVNVTYTLSSTAGDSRGFDGAAFGDPRVIEQARSPFDARHRVQIQAGKALPAGFSFTLFLVAASGLPYTPIVNGDVNGDGVGGDRAFIPDPARTSDPGIATAMRSLLTAGPSTARNCLQEQLGRAAGRNSCEGPWTATASARLATTSMAGPWSRRVRAAFSLTNPLAGLDQALHGESGMRGWGASVPPDAVLLTVRGFDPVANRFRYEVNPRFGSSSPSQTTVRVPFRATLDISMDIGPSSGKQQLERVLNRGRDGNAGKRLTADSIRMRFGRNVRNPYADVIDEADSLLLSRDQMDSLCAGSERYVVKANALWQALGVELAALDDRYDSDTATDKTEATTDLVWEFAREEVARIKVILTPLQMTLAPWVVQYLASAVGKINIRMYMY